MTISPYGLILFRRQTDDGIGRPPFWQGRGCVNNSYGHIRISADGIVRACCGWDSGCANGSYGLVVWSVVIQRCYCMCSLYLWRQTSDGIARDTQIARMGSRPVA